MSGDATPITTEPSRRRRFLLSVMTFLIMVFFIGWLLNQASRFLDRQGRPAGFGVGVLQGALMPLALPNLAVGHDVVIYSSNNTGRMYKLGYTVGVNGCGLLFFGLFFWRVGRLRRGFQGAGNGRKTGCDSPSPQGRGLG